MTYILAYTEEARSAVQSLDAETKAEALGRLFSLTEEPRPKGSRPLNPVGSERNRAWPIAPYVLAHYVITEDDLLIITVVDIFDGTPRT